MKADVKPGTRCECNRLDCQLAGMAIGQSGHTTYGRSWETQPYRCTRDAVRLVTVDCERDKFGVPQTRAYRAFMCAACAEYHERDQKERETASAIHAIHGMPGEPEPGDGYDYGLCECGQPANPSGHCDHCEDLEPEDE